MNVFEQIEYLESLRQAGGFALTSNPAGDYIIGQLGCYGRGPTLADALQDFQARKEAAGNPPDQR